MPQSPTGDPVPRVLAIANQKGGVGKTTTAINLAAALAQLGHRTLLIDLDPQGNASTGLGVDPGRRAGSYALIEGAGELAALELDGGLPGLTVIPADNDLAGAEIELVDAERREYRLREALSPTGSAAGTAGAGDRRHAFVLIDCPPSLGLLTLNALVAADAVLVPLQCEFFALEGVSQLTRTVERIRRAFNPALRLEGLVLTMFDRRNNLSELVAADARGFFGTQVFETVIPRNIRISEAQSHGKPASVYDGKSSGALAYARLAEELLARTGRAPA